MVLPEADTLLVPAATLVVPGVTLVVPAPNLGAGAATLVVPGVTLRVPAATFEVPAATLAVPAVTLAVPGLGEVKRVPDTGAAAALDVPCLPKNASGAGEAERGGGDTPRVGAAGRAFAGGGEAARAAAGVLTLVLPLTGAAGALPALFTALLPALLPFSSSDLLPPFLFDRRAAAATPTTATPPANAGLMLLAEVSKAWEQKQQALQHMCNSLVHSTVHVF